MEDNYFTILWCFLPCIHMNRPQVCMCPPHPEPSSHLLPYPLPLGCPRAAALDALHHAWTCIRSSVLHMVMYMFQCCSLRSSHPRLLPQSPIVCSLASVSFVALPVGSSVLSFWIPYICVNIQYLSFSHLIKQRV